MSGETYIPTPNSNVEYTNAPVDGDDDKAQTFRVMLDDLADGIARLNQEVIPGESLSGSLPLRRPCGNPTCVANAGRSFGPPGFPAQAESTTNPTTSGTRAMLTYDLQWPHETNATKIEVWVDPNNSGSLPDGKRIELAIVATSVTDGSQVSLGTFEDPAATEAAFEAKHLITWDLTSLDIQVDRDVYEYSLQVHGEYGTGRQSGTIYFGAWWSGTLGSIDQGAG